MGRKSPGNGAPGTAFDVVAVAASAGGLKALSDVLSALTAAFPAPVVIVQHLDPRHRSLMADILSRRTPREVKQAEEGHHLTVGAVYIALPNKHLLVNPDGSLSLAQTELVPLRPPVGRPPLRVGRRQLQAEQLRATPGGRRMRLVALTGYGRPEDRQRARDAGFDAHLVKPVDPDELARMLEGRGAS